MHAILIMKVKILTIIFYHKNTGVHDAMWDRLKQI